MTTRHKQGINTYAGFWPAVVVTAIIGLVTYTATAVLALTPQYGAIEYIFRRKKVAFFNSENMGVAFRWSIFVLGILIAVSGLVGGIFLGTSSAPAAAITVIILFIGLLMLALVILAVLLYFVNQELAIQKKGPIEAMKGSYKLIKSNFWETIVFSLLTGILIYLVSIVPNTIVGFLAQFAFMLVAVNPLFIGILVIALLVMVAVSLIIESAELILRVEFYKKILKGKERKVRKKKAS